MAAELRKRSITIVVAACRAGGEADTVAVAILAAIIRSTRLAAKAHDRTGESGRRQVRHCFRFWPKTTLAANPDE